LDIDINETEIRTLIYLTKQQLKIQSKRRRENSYLHEIKLRQLETLIEKLETAEINA
jgi:hypothetical protein